MSNVYRAVPVPSFSRQSWPLRTLADWSLGLALWEDQDGPGYDSDEVLAGAAPDRSLHELLALLEAVEAFRIDH